MTLTAQAATAVALLGLSWLLLKLGECRPRCPRCAMLIAEDLRGPVCPKCDWRPR